MGSTLTQIGKALALCAGAFSCSAGTVAHAAATPLSLERTGKWLMDYDTDSCRLAAAFGADKDEVYVFFTRFEPGDSFYLDLAGRHFDTSEAAPKVSVDFGPIDNPRSFTAIPGDAKGKPMLIGLHDDLLDRGGGDSQDRILLPLTPQQEAAVSYVVVRQSGHRPIRLELRPMGEPMRAMRACTDDLVHSWGLDPTVQGGLSRLAQPVGSPGNWLRSSDYPTGMLMTGGQGLVQFRLEIDEQGAVSGCHIQGHTKPEGFTDLTCRFIASRAKFRPALDTSGKPVKSYYVNRVHWMIGQPR